MRRSKEETAKSNKSLRAGDLPDSSPSSGTSNRSTAMSVDEADLQVSGPIWVKATPPRYAQQLTVFLFAAYVVWLMFLAWVAYKVLSA